MKIIEALKGMKDLQRKAEDLRTKIGKHSAYLSTEHPVYDNQKQQVAEWLQAHSDILKEILSLKVRIQKTNLATPVTIELGGKQVVKNISEWVIRRRELAQYDLSAWKMLTDRGLTEGKIKQSNGEYVDVKIVRCYEPKERDNNLDLYSSEPSIIDGKLEIVNAVTDLVE